MQVFRDESGWRAIWVSSIVKGIAGVLAAVAVALIVIVVKKPALPEFSKAEEPPQLMKGPALGKPLVVGPAFAKTTFSPSADRPMSRYAFFDSGDERSVASLEANAADLDGVFMNWMTLDPKGGIRTSEIDDRTKALRWMSAHARHLKKYATVINAHSAKTFAEWTATPEVARKHASDLARRLKSDGFDGVLIDFVDFDTLRAQGTTAFLGILKTELSRQGSKLIVLAHPTGDPRFIAASLRKADLVVLATHLSAVRVSLVPTQSEIEQRLKAAASLIPSDKLIVGIGSYATLTSGEGTSDTISVYQSWSLSESAGAPLTLDQNLVGQFQFVKDATRTFDVRVLDGVTAFNLMRAALVHKPAGIAVWRLGMEDSSVWHVAGKGKFPDAKALPKLEKLEGADDLSGQIDGAIFSVTAVNKVGSRRVVYDASRGLIVSERLLSAPVSYTASNWVRSSNKLATISFDDGPDEKYTPQILDILKEKSVRATFFVTGTRALASPALMKRIYDEGHDIGNHTFSHPDLANRTGFEIDVELNATQRAIEKVLGVRTKLFRAPYSSVSFETSPHGLRVLERASRLGYVSLRVTVDPYDWAGPSSQLIVDRVKTRIATMDKASNIVVLLHDSGGNRKPTIEALPVIIDQLRAAGYTLVPSHELMEGGPDTLMPPVAAAGSEPQTLSALSGFGVDIYTALAGVLPALAVFTIILSLSRSFLVSIFAVLHARTVRDRRGAASRPSVAVIIPAYNEAKVILKTIESVRASGYPNLDIVVVDDGSKDNTYSVVEQAYQNGEVRLFRVPNAGKASALNSGIAHTNAEIVVAIDADTVLAANAIELLARHFGDPQVGAVAGKAVVGNEASFMSKFQSLEYITSQNLDRRAFERFNAISVVPGAIGAWRRSALVTVGGFRHDTLAEDADATISIVRDGYRVLYEPDAVAYTEAPETTGAFLKQRFRWMFGTLQVAFKHRGAFLQKDAHGIGCIALPNIVIFQIGFTLLAPIFDLILAANFLSMARGYLIGDEVAANVSMLAVYWLAFQSVDAVLLALAARLDGGGSVWRLAPHLLIQRFFYRQLLYVVAVKTLFAAVAGTFVGWGKLVRTGNVAARPA